MEGSSRTSAAQALDPEAIASLADLIGDDPEGFAEIVDAFLAEAPGRIAEIHQGVASADATLAGRAAHTLKSNAQTFGAGELADLARRLEELSRGGDLTTASELLRALDAAWASTRPLLVELRDRGGG